MADNIKVWDADRTKPCGHSRMSAPFYDGKLVKCNYNACRKKWTVTLVRKDELSDKLKHDVFAIEWHEIGRNE